MTLELIGHMWLITAALVSVFGFHATWRDWGYNKTITKEKPCQRRIPKHNDSYKQSGPLAGLSVERTSPGEATWSLGAEVLARSLSIGKNNKTKEPAAASGSKETTMGMMKRIGIPILEALAEGPCTRMELWNRVEDQLQEHMAWENFKRFMSMLRSDGMIVTLPCSIEHPHTRVDLSADGQEFVQAMAE